MKKSTLTLFLHKRVFKKSIIFSIAIGAFTCQIPLAAQSVNSKPGNSSHRRDQVGQEYTQAMQQIRCKNWLLASRLLERVVANGSGTDLTPEALFYLGVSYYHQGYYHAALTEFNRYLKEQASPQYFEAVIFYKFSIAEQFRCGAGKPVFGVKGFPQWLAADQEAIELYDEVASSLPNEDVAARALYNKSIVLKQMRDYRDSSEAFQAMIRRFPKHMLAPCGYIEIADNYLMECRSQHHNPDLLVLAELNVQRFKKAFPGDTRISVLDEKSSQMREIYARGLYDMGSYYERKKQLQASAIYYNKAIGDFPGTEAATLSSQRICLLKLPVLTKKVEVSDVE